jgi:predicted GIY-YIG superfamily endonuclease
MNAPGYVYVIAFSNGTVKVGRAQDALRRVAAHKGDARKFGHAINDCWTSPLHLEWYANEDTLKKLAVKFGGTPIRAEYFTGTDYAAIVNEALTLPFTPPAPEDAEASAEHGEDVPPELAAERKRVEALFALPRTPDPELSAWAEVLVRAGRRAAGRYLAERMVAAAKPTPEQYAAAAAALEAQVKAAARVLADELLRGNELQAEAEEADAA